MGRGPLLGKVGEFQGKPLGIGRRKFDFLLAQGFWFGSYVWFWKLGRGHLFFRLATAHQKAHLIYQASNRLKGFSQGVVRANSAGLRFVEGFEGANQKHNRNMLQLVVLFYVLANFIAVYLL